MNVRFTFDSDQNGGRSRTAAKPKADIAGFGGRVIRPIAAQAWFDSPALPHRELVFRHNGSTEPVVQAVTCVWKLPVVVAVVMVTVLNPPPAKANPARVGFDERAAKALGRFPLQVNRKAP